MTMKKLLVLIDLSGTLHVDNVCTRSAVEALQILRDNRSKLRFKFVTNTTKESSANLLERLRRCGFDDVRPLEIFSSLAAAKRIVQKREIRPFLFLEDEALDDFKDVPIDNPNAVVVGLAPSRFNFGNLNRAFKILLDSPSAPLIAIHKGRYYRTEKGDLSLGPGPFVECLEFATGRKAEIVGKPLKAFFHQAIEQLITEINEEDGNQTAEETNEVNGLQSPFYMIGDDVRDDILGAIAAGGRGILVRTGKYRTGDENEIPVEQRICVENYYEAVQYLLTQMHD